MFNLDKGVSLLPNQGSDAVTRAAHVEDYVLEINIVHQKGDVECAE